QTRGEREETIRDLEAGEKLEDIKALQDAVGRARDDATKGENQSANKDAPAETSGEALHNLDAASIREQQEREEAKKDIFALRVDDNGIYDLITRQLVA